MMLQPTPGAHDQSYLNVTSTMAKFPLPSVTSRIMVNWKVDIDGRVIMCASCL